MTERETQEFEVRWTAWQRRGAVHEKSARRQLLIALPILVLIAGSVTWFAQ